jgi:hypothetical protein
MEAEHIRYGYHRLTTPFLRPINTFPEEFEFYFRTLVSFRALYLRHSLHHLFSLIAFSCCVCWSGSTATLPLVAKSGVGICGNLFFQGG